MANRKQFKLSREKRHRRKFSESFKQEKVAEIEQGIVGVTELSRRYEVSRSSIYKWVNKYGSQVKGKGEWLVVENESDSLKLRAAERQIAELERALGQKQLQLQFLEKMVSLAEKEYGIDLKKNSGEPL